VQAQLASALERNSERAYVRMNIKKRRERE
jgi:hypothetical protein